MTWTCTSRSEEHTSELQSPRDLVCRLLLAKKKGTLSIVVRQRRHTLHRAWGDAGFVRDTTRAPVALVETATNKDERAASVTVFFNDTATTKIHILSQQPPLHI